MFDIHSFARRNLMALAEVAVLFAGLAAEPARLPVTQRRVGPRPARSKYMPHQSDRERARRVRQINRGLGALFG